MFDDLIYIYFRYDYMIMSYKHSLLERVALLDDVTADAAPRDLRHQQTGRRVRRQCAHLPDARNSGGRIVIGRHRISDHLIRIL